MIFFEPNAPPKIKMISRKKKTRENIINFHDTGYWSMKKNAQKETVHTLFLQSLRKGSKIKKKII